MCIRHQTRLKLREGSGSYTFEIADNSDPGAYIDEDYYSDDTDEAARIGFRNSTPGNKTVYVKVTGYKRYGEDGCC